MKREYFGERLKHIRQLKGITQSQLAENVCSQSMLSRIEKGETEATTYICISLADKLGIGLNELLFEGESPTDQGIKQIKEDLRNAARRSDYSLIKNIVKSQKNNSTFNSSIILKQFLKWHEAIYIYYLEKDLEGAKLIIEKALNYTNYSSKKELSQQELGLLISLSIFYAEEGEEHQTINLLEETLTKIKKKIGETDTTLLLRIYYNLSKALHNTHQYRKSIKYAVSGLNLSIRKEHLYLTGELHYQHGECLSRLNQKNQAIEELKKAQWIFERIEMYNLVKVVKSHVEMIINDEGIPFE